MIIIVLAIGNQVFQHLGMGQLAPVVAIVTVAQSGWLVIGQLERKALV